MYFLTIKRITTETSHQGNASKTAFEKFRFYFGKSLKTGKGLEISEYFRVISQYL